MRFLIPLLCAVLSLLPATARAQAAQPELDALLAPVALYPDDVVRIVLDAATAPAEIAEAAQWSRNNRGMTGEDSVRAVQGTAWRPSVKALVAYPELLDRMAESPQWTYDLGSAWIAQQANVMSTIQTLRQRAYASGTLRSDQYQTVQASDQGIVVQPAMPYIYYVPYYDPLVVYGGWWWPAYRPVYWRPWYSRPVFVTRVAVVNRGLPVVNRGFHSPQKQPHAVVPPRGTPSPAVRYQRQSSAQFVGRQQAASRPSPAHRAPVVQGHAGPPAQLSYQRPSSGHGGGSRGGQGGGHRGRS